VATETDAARDRVLAARAALGEELEVLEASARAAVDVPARIRRNPVRAGAVVGGVGFLALRGPQRLFRAGKRAVFGAPPPIPKTMLPDEIEKTLRKLGGDGDKIRGTLERDFAAYAVQTKNRRQALRTLLILSVARPLLARGARAGADWLFRADDAGFQSRLAQIRERASGLGSRDNSADEANAEPVVERAERAERAERSADRSAEDAAADEAAGNAGA
jgi:hypothetical protein